MKRLIDADELKGIYSRWSKDIDFNLEDVIDAMPEAYTEAELDGELLVKPLTAKWEPQPDRTIRCSNCGAKIRPVKPSPYCSNCGARMRV